VPARIRQRAVQPPVEQRLQDNIDEDAGRGRAQDDQYGESAATRGEEQRTEQGADDDGAARVREVDQALEHRRVVAKVVLDATVDCPVESARPMSARIPDAEGEPRNKRGRRDGRKDSAAHE
jgi:hypothetical protein